MRKSFLLILILSAVLLAPAVSMAKSELDGKELYLLTNIWFESPKKISSLNFHKGSMLRAGDKVKVLKVKRGYILFHPADKPDLKFKLIFHRKYHPDKKSIDYAKLHFGPKDPLKSKAYAGFSKAEKDGIDRGRPVKGMHKKAFLMAFGYPPAHRTQSLDLNTWLYWTSRWVTKAYRFDGKDRLINPEGKN